ncbi:MAG: prepilin-type N-terminal cleavage/methylation domain-containing protein, partial [Endomicrobiales bacterium]
MSTLHHLRPRTHGFTLVELIVSVFIFTILMVFGMSFFSMGNVPFLRAKRTMFAVSYGEGEMERYQSIAWSNLGSTVTTTVDPNTGTTFTDTIEVTTVTIGSTLFAYIGSSVTWPGQNTPVDFETARS